MTIVGVLTALVVRSVNPAQFTMKARYASAKFEIEEISKAAKLYGDANGAYPADVNLNIPSQFEPYFGYTSGKWPTGTFPGSVLDWDNWENQTYWEGSTGIIQVTMRQISGLNVVPGREWTMFHVIKGKGVPHCSTTSTEGECINCAVKYGFFGNIEIRQLPEVGQHIVLGQEIDPSREVQLPRSMVKGEVGTARQ